MNRVTSKSPTQGRLSILPLKKPLVSIKMLSLTEEQLKSFLNFLDAMGFVDSPFRSDRRTCGPGWLPGIGSARTAEFSSGWVKYKKKKIVCQEKSTTRYGRILPICSNASPALDLNI
jgi:hypothetical protein